MPSISSINGLAPASSTLLHKHGELENVEIGVWTVGKYLGEGLGCR